MNRSDLPPLGALRAFEAAARLGSVSAAAGELHVTHGAVSRQVKALEAHLGLPLFARAGRGLRLTDAGSRLRDAVGSGFARIEAEARALRTAPGDPPLVLGCPGSVLARWMIPRMERLQRELPALKLHLAASESIPDARLTGLDAALLIASPPWPAGWQVQRLAGERIGPVLSPQHPAYRTLAGAPPAALLGQPLLHTASRPGAWRAWAQGNGLDPGGLCMGTAFEHLYYLLEAAGAGLGVAIAPQQLVAGDIASGRLAAPWGFTATGGHWVLCTPPRDDPRIAPLLQWLQRALADPAAGEPAHG